MKRLALIAVLFLLTSVSVRAGEFAETKALAEQGNAHAQFELGLMYEAGRSVPQNYVEAAKWYRKASMQGHTGAQSNLAGIYAEGKGLPREDPPVYKYHTSRTKELAYVWFIIAATSGDEIAIKNRDFYAKKHSLKTIDSAQKEAAKIYEQIQQGNTETPVYLIPPSVYLIPPSVNPVPPSSTAVEPVNESSGTCFFVDGFGTAVTNNHVIDGAHAIEVITANGSKSSATIIKASNVLDVAVLATGHQTPKYLTVAENNTLALGQDVFTMGFPVTNLLGDKPKYSEGSISALSGLGDDDSWIQMSTPIQPGNSGGPLVNENGQVVGIVTATAAVEKFFAVTGSLPQNINWAIKAQYARALIPETSSKPQFSNKQEAISHTEKSICRVIAN